MSGSHFQAIFWTNESDAGQTDGQTDVYHKEKCCLWIMRPRELSAFYPPAAWLGIKESTFGIIESGLKEHSVTKMELWENGK